MEKHAQKIITDHLRRLEGVPLPPFFEEAIGYAPPPDEGGETPRYLCFYWQGSKLYWTDGRLGTSAPMWRPFLAWARSFRVAPLIRPVAFGSDDAMAEHAFVLDRKTRALYYGPVHTGEATARAQHVTEEDLRAAENARRDGRSAPPLDQDALREAHRRFMALLEAYGLAGRAPCPFFVASQEERHLSVLMDHWLSRQN